MIKKLIAIFAISFASILLLFSNTHVRAQEANFDFARAYQDYVFTKDNYESALSSYRLARSQYLQAQTLVSQSKARDATVTMLQARDDVVIAYLISLRMKLSETDGISETATSGLSQRLDVEISWFRDHKSRITSAGTLDDLVKDSEEAYTHFGLVTEAIAYETLSTIAGGKVEVLRDDLSALLSKTRQKTFEIESNNNFDIGLIQRWLTEIEQKITRSLDKSIAAEGAIQEVYDTKPKDFSDRLKVFNSSIANLQESYQLLRDGNNFMKEIIRELTE